MNVDRKSAYFVAAAALLAIASSRCTHRQRRTPAASATSTGADRHTYTPDSIVLYLARREIAGACRDDLSPTIDFRPATAELAPHAKVELEKWAICMQRPELRDANVVVLPPSVAQEGAALFAERNRSLRDELIVRGVDPAHVIVGAPQSRVGDGPPPSADALRLGLAMPARE